MSTHIVIDGYNLIRQCSRLIDLEAISLEEGRMGLIRMLADYKKKKSASITVVFDGEGSDNLGQANDKILGVNIIYSRRGEKADDVIKRLSNKNKDRLIIVTSDRAIATHADKQKSTVISSPEFENKMLAEAVYDESEFYDDEEDESPQKGTRKKGPARRLKRSERKSKRKLEKL